MTGTSRPRGIKKVVGEDTAGLMLTNPNTLGLFKQK